MDKIQERFKIGLETYGHGVYVLDDTRQWNTPTNSWINMAEEEILDALIYTAADILRKKYTLEQNANSKSSNEENDNDAICIILQTNNVYPIIDKLWDVYFDMLKLND